MIKIKSLTTFKNTYNYFKKAISSLDDVKLKKYGELGVIALSENTPKDTGKTSKSWDYEIIKQNGKVTIKWINTNEVNGVNIAIILQYGHGTKDGGYVKGIDYINPTMRPVFEQIANEAWEEFKT